MKIIYKGYKKSIYFKQVFGTFECVETLYMKKMNHILTVCINCSKEKIFQAASLFAGCGVVCKCSNPHFHSSSKTLLYYIHNNMLQRCCWSGYDCYVYYGGRGISVWEEWLDFRKFKEWALGNGYREGLTLERKDTDGDYCPENCIWLPPEDQSRNKRKFKNNTSGVTGVLKNIDRWVAQWNDGKQRSKSFSINKYGEEEAFRLACEYREQQIQRLKNEGVYYGEKHGM